MTQWQLLILTESEAFATGATGPDGYAQVFSNQGGSVSASNYMGLYTLTSYDTLTCASLCDQAEGCIAFNIYIERNPSLDPAAACPNPPSTTNFKCTLWGVPVTLQEATNTGQWRNDFHVVITGSNGKSPLHPIPLTHQLTCPATQHTTKPLHPPPYPASAAPSN
jgi:hypothetical protein